MGKKVSSDKAAIADFRDELDQLLSLIVKHWAAVGALASVAGALISYGILMVYSKAVGRMDLIPLVFDKKFSALLPWMAFFGFVVLLYMVLFLTMTVLYALAVSLFNAAPMHRPHVARLLLIPANLGALLFVASVFQLPSMGHGVVALTILFFMLVAMLLLLLSQRFRTALRLVISNSKPYTLTKRRQVGLFFAAYIAVSVAAFAATYPMIILLHSYTGADTPEAVNTLTVISMVTVFLLFVPALVFFVSKKRIALRVIQAVAVALIATFTIITIYPGATSTIVYKSAEMMGVRVMNAQQYRLLKNFEIGDFAATSWHVTEAKGGLPIVSAFPLFSLGDILLLCPDSQMQTRLGDWPKRSRACILTQGSDVVRLPEGDKESKVDLSSSPEHSAG